MISRLSTDDEVVMESTGSVRVNLYERLEQVHMKVVLANPLIDRSSKDEYFKLLLSMTGVDVYSALLISSEVRNISRISSYKKLIS